MRSTATDRRTLLGGIAAGPTAAIAARAWAATPPGRSPGPRYLGSRADGAEGFRVSGFDAAGAVRFDPPIPARGHSFAVHPNRRLAVHFAGGRERPPRRLA